MNVCLINPRDNTPQYEDNEYCYNCFNMPHLGLGYVGAVLEQHGFKVEILECMACELNTRDILAKINQKDYGLIGLSSYFYNYTHTFLLVNRFKAFDPAPFIFLGGYLPSLGYKLIPNLLNKVDCCIIGEGEETALELVQAKAGGRDWHSIPGLIYLDKAGTLIQTGKRPLIEDLDRLPYPRRVFFSKRKTAAVISSRGCYGRCIFCGVREFYEQNTGEHVRLRTPLNVIREMEYLSEEHGVKYLYFNDDNFLTGSRKHRQWLMEFCTELRMKPLDIKFRVNSRADGVSRCREELPMLKDAGLDCIYIGIESFVQRQLDFYGKHIKAETNLEALDILKILGIAISIGFIMLDPHTTIDEVIYNVKTLKSTRFYENAFPGHQLISTKIPLTPIMGTVFYDYLVKENLVYNNPLNYRFEDKKADLFHDLKSIWTGFVQPVYLKYHCFYRAEEQGLHSLADALRNKQAELLELDLDFLEQLASGIKEESIVDKEGVNDLVKNYSKALETIRSFYSQAEETILGRCEHGN